MSKELLDQFQEFVETCIDVEGDGDPLSLRLNVLERIVELLRLRSQEMRNNLQMTDLLASELTWGDPFANETVIKVRLRNSGLQKAWSARDARKHSELQKPLALYLLRNHRQVPRIEEVLTELLSQLRDGLTPLDMETTRTGVTRASTTLREASRTLRLNGLVVDTAETAYKTWELSILGLLVAAKLHKNDPTIELRDRHHPLSDGGRGGGHYLTSELRGAVESLKDVHAVRACVRLVLDEDQGVFATLDAAAETIADYCEQCETRWLQLKPDWFEQRKAAEDLVRSVEERIPRRDLADDLAKSVALSELLRS